MELELTLLFAILEVIWFFKSMPSISDTFPSFFYELQEGQVYLSRPGDRDPLWIQAGYLQPKDFNQQGNICLGHNHDWLHARP